MAKTATPKVENTEKKDALRLALDSIEKDYGKGSVVSSGMKQEVYETSTSGSIGLDIALGIGGLAYGKTYEYFGWESSGKSTGTLEAIAGVQAKGQVAALIDGEHSFDPSYAKKLGVDVDKLLISQPGWGEQGYDISMRLMESGKVKIVVIDSQTALLPKKVIDSNIGEGAMGLHARLMSEAIPKLMASAARNKVILIIISQLREKIGVMFGNPETTNGGHALKFYAHGRIRWSKIAPKTEDDVAVSNPTTAKVVKNKMAPPFRIAKFDIIYNEGIDRAGEILDIATDLEIVQKSGSWFAYGDSKIGQGRAATRTFLLDNPDLMEEIRLKVMAIINAGATTTVVKQGAPEVEEFDDEKNAELGAKEAEELLATIKQD